MYVDATDSFLALSEIGSQLRKRVQITFVNEHGVEEAGIDGGGVLKEFMDTVTKVRLSLQLNRRTYSQRVSPVSL